LDVAGANMDMLKNFGIPMGNIQKSNLCTYEVDYLLHSYRQHGPKSGRALGVIAMKENHAE
ncbi:MAG: laccase domain-containing protein, partial [Ignavibacteriaceae bacterium]|nr:laccase domain-containing protein [Ignavibacteriaceae bacterium]